ncbi:ABC transporter permease [Chloroflexi bacterium TSY]|nr:ABC transporter permease [Chloroflexi bacterium TSY]
MIQYLIRRLLYLILTAFGLPLLVFLLMQLVPGSVVTQMVDLQGQINSQQMAELRAFFGLDQPWYIQFGNWMMRTWQGDLGTSWRTGIPVTKVLFDSLAVTLELALLATIFSVLIGIPMGILAAQYRQRWPDLLLRTTSLLGLSTPVFWQGTMLLLLFSLYLRWTPPLRWISPRDDLVGNLTLMALPVITLGTASAAAIVRITRTSMLEVYRREYITVARGKGLSTRAILFTHALRNMLIPVLTVIGLQMGYLFGGAVVVEEVFTLPGIGRLLLQGIIQRDFPVVQGATLVIALLFALTNLIVDLLYGVADPRVRYS